VNLYPITLKQANEFVTAHHRHHRAVVGQKFSIGLQENGELVGVAICGRPIARMADDGLSLEIYRVCTLGGKNACSMLYGACSRAAKAMGYTKIITYTFEDEIGSSLLASNFDLVGHVSARSWSCPSRKREDKSEIKAKHKWGRTL